MPHQVTIKPSNHVVTVGEGETVLAAALREGITLPYGCRNGACGACKGKILEGQVDYGNPQPHVLADFEKKAGLALFCQAKPLTDLVIEASRQGWLNYKAAGSVVEITFPGLLTPQEEKAAYEQA